MNSFDLFMKEAGNYTFNVQINEAEKESLLVSDVLFHTPIISLALLVIISSRKDLTVSEMPNWLGAVLSEAFWGTKSANRKLEWSLVLRKRYADALIFLESNHLVTVKGKNRKIEISDEGKKFIRKNQNRTDTFGQLVRGFRTATGNIAVKGFSLL